MVGNREKCALIKVNAGNLWICGKPGCTPRTALMYRHGQVIMTLREYALFSVYTAGTHYFSLSGTRKMQRTHRGDNSENSAKQERVNAPKIKLHVDVSLASTLRRLLRFRRSIYDVLSLSRGSISFIYSARSRFIFCHIIPSSVILE